MLHRLKPRARELLWLAYMEGMTHREIASATGLNVMSVRILLLRARREAAALLTPKGEEDARETGATNPAHAAGSRFRGRTARTAGPRAGLVAIAIPPGVSSTKGDLRLARKHTLGGGLPPRLPDVAHLVQAARRNPHSCPGPCCRCCGIPLHACLSKLPQLTM